MYDFKFIRNPKNNILVSFSGGETSGFMINWLLKNKPDYNYKFIFANTGEECEETLLFAKRCQDFFGIDLIWVEYDDNNGFKVVNFETAYRSHNPIEVSNGWQNHPFRKFVRKYGLPNIVSPTCTRELKEYPINRFCSSNGWKPSIYDKAIGIRFDELDRVGRLYYPLLEIDCTKQMVNSFWDKMPFRLNIKGYEGNCKTCWKKSLRKLVTIARYNPEWFAFFKVLEDEYGNYIPEKRKLLQEQNGKNINFPIRMFRNNKSVDEILEMAKDLSIEDAVDDKFDFAYQKSIYHDGSELDIISGCSESCEAFK